MRHVSIDKLMHELSEQICSIIGHTGKQSIPKTLHLNKLAERKHPTKTEIIQFQTSISGMRTITFFIELR